MFVTLLLVVLGLVVLGGVVVKSPRGYVIAGVAFLGGIIVALGSMTTIIGATEVGVPISFGNVGAPMSPGLKAKAPWTDVETYPTRPFTADDQVVQARTKQAGSVQYKVGARWHVDAKQAQETYKQIRSGDEDQINQKIIDPNLATAAGNVAATRDNLSATTDRLGIEGDLLKELGRLTASYGVVIDTVTIRHIEPDQATAAAISQLAQQQQQTKIASERVATATQEALAREQEALGAKQSAKDLGNPTPSQTFLLCLQAWERVASAAASHGVAVYANPCGGASVGAVVQAK